jgi:endonuclease YncB( thermonuclease family)
MIAKGEFLQIKCSDGRDEYGRLTCDVLNTNGESLNLQMVKDRYAYAMPSPCFNQADGMMYLGYQYLAKFSQVGLWRYGV